ncbi:guanine nucleotide-binding protein alpha subunit [Coprinopsis cinerea AmutBmut pab1-1]|nr:guanine nucleotide-binding protein alpha subunit [Coprinopsis cinerea AmutBmut pab1-1]
MLKSREKLAAVVTLTPNPFLSKGWSGANPNETEEEAQMRIKHMQEAHKKSKEIDSSLQEARKAMEKRRKGVKILLLGQSESGKSSVLKNFQRAFAPKHFENERLVWRTIIQLNIISSLRLILDALKDEWEPSGSGATPTTPTEASHRAPARKLRRLRLTLSPLFFIESNILKIISPNCKECRDVCVSGTEWKVQLSRRQRPQGPPGGYEPRGGPPGRRRSQSHINNENDPTNVLCASRDEIIDLWTDPIVQEVLRKRGVYLEQMPGFFMNDIARIAVPGYLPSDSDIIRARIRTVGVEEHHFVVEKGPDMNSDVYITDVGGSRSQRASWIPYFEDVQAILFLAPLAFNQTLQEAVKVNRLEDSLHLWRDICQSKLLAKANLILFFNKMDVLKATLAAGVLVRKYVPSYGDLPNDAPTVTKYFRERFKIIHKRFSPQARPFMSYETSAIVCHWIPYYLRRWDAS